MKNPFDQFDENSGRVDYNPFDEFDAPQQTAQPEPAQPVRQEIEPNAIRTAFDQFGQGLSFGLIDEGQDVLGAAGAKAYDKLSGENSLPSFKETLRMAREQTRQRLDEQLAKRTGLSLTSNIAGSILTGGAGASTKLGKSLADTIRTGSLGARMLKGGAAGMVSGAAYGFGQGRDTLEERAASAGRGGLLGAVGGAVIPAAGAGINKLNKKTIIPTSEEIRKSASSLFKKADDIGGVIKPEVSDKFYDEVLSIRPQTEAGKIFKGDSPVNKILDAVPALKGKPLTLQAAKEVDEALGDLAYGTMDTFGKMTSDGVKFLNMQAALRSMVDDADEAAVIGGKDGFAALKEARKQWSASLKMRDIERIIQSAQGKEQPVTVIRNGFSNLLKRGDKLKGYTPSEIKAIKRASETGFLTGFLKLAGSGLVPIGAGIAGTAATGGVGGLATAAGAYGLQQGAKSLGVYNQMSRANDVAKAIAERAGMAKEAYTAPLISKLLAGETLSYAPASGAVTLGDLLAR